MRRLFSFERDRILNEFSIIEDSEKRGTEIYKYLILDKEKCVQIAEANNFFILAEETTN